MRATKLLSAAFVLLAMPLPGGQGGSGSGSTIQLGGFELRLGMSQDAVLKKLTTVYDVKSQDRFPGNNWVVFKKGGSPDDSIGTLAFSEERLSFASRSWGPEDQSARSFALALHAAVRATPGSGPCTISTSAADRDGTQLFLSCGHRRLFVLVPSDPGTATVISEAISKKWQ